MWNIFIWAACLFAIARSGKIYKRHIPCEPSHVECVFRYVASNNLAAINPLVLHKIKVQMPEFGYVSNMDTLTVDGLADLTTLKFEFDENNKATVTQQSDITLSGDLKEVYTADDGDHRADDDNYSLKYPNTTVRSEFSVVRSEVGGQQFLQFADSRYHVEPPFLDALFINSDNFKRVVAADEHIRAVMKQFLENSCVGKKSWQQHLINYIFKALFDHYNMLLLDAPIFL